MFLKQMDDLAKDDWNAWGLTYRTWYGFVLMQLGEREAGLSLLERTRQDALDRIRGGDERPGVVREIAAIHAARGEEREACEWLARAVASGWRLEAVRASPLLASVGGHEACRNAQKRIDDELRRENAEIERRQLRVALDH